MKFSNLSKAKSVTTDTTLFWFRRDLRLSDNAGLYHALKNNPQVIPLFIFDTNILDQLEDRRDSRVEFILAALAALRVKLEHLGSALLVLQGNPPEIFGQLRPRAVYANHDYEPYARQRDKAVHDVLLKKEIPFRTFKDHVIFERDEIVKDDGKPYSIFTPYAKKWKSLYSAQTGQRYPTARFYAHFQRLESLPLPSLKDLGFAPSGISFPKCIVKKSTIAAYAIQRNFPAVQGTTRLSVHLRFGTISIRKCSQMAFQNSEVWLHELIWRDFYHMILWHFPQVATQAFKPAYDRVAWRNDPDTFAAWCEGRTGYPIVDAGMRELNATGFMHNRVRMIVASFLTKHLLIDWRWGEAYFGQKLLDYDLAANNGGWQWASGSGCDAAPYFRVFNPQLQTEKFDPTLTYVKRWVPELNSPLYPAPIVDHKMARDRALKVYRKALSPGADVQ